MENTTTTAGTDTSGTTPPSNPTTVNSNSATLLGGEKINNTSAASTTSTTVSAVATETNGDKLGDNWFSKYGDGYDSLKKFSSVESLAKSYVNMEKLISQKTIKPLSDNPTADELAKYREAWGIPATVDKYDVKFDEKYKNIIQEGDINDFKKFAHENNIPPKLAEQLIHWQAERTQKTIGELQQQQQNNMVESQNALKTEWGLSYDRNINNAIRGAKAIAGEDIINDTELANNPKFIKFASRVGELLGEKAILTGDEKSDVSNFQHQIDKIVNDKSSPYWQKGHSQHEDLVNRVFKLRQMKQNFS